MSTLKLSQLTLNISPTSKKLLIIAPPLIIGSIYLCRKSYSYFAHKKPEEINEEVIVGEEYSLSNSTSINQALVVDGKDNPDGCVWSSDGKKVRSVLSNSTKCSYCKTNQKLSFREANVYDTSLKNFSTGQLLKFGYDNLNTVLKSLEEFRIKQYALKEYTKIENTGDLENKVDTLFEQLNKIQAEFEQIRNEFMPATYSVTGHEEDDDFDDQASYLSSATTTSLGFWDPEPNLHFFEFYQEALRNVANIKPPKTDRTHVTLCDSYEDFLAKVHCLRQAFAHLFLEAEIRSRYIKIGEDILKVILDNRMRDSTECINAYHSFLDFVLNEENLNTIELEISHRKIAYVSFYDIVLDYMILESFDDLENPSSAVKSVVNNRWLSESFREISLQTAVSALMRRKRSKLIVPDGFFAHFYSMLDHLSPVIAWGFLGTNEDLKFKCHSLKESIHAVVRDFFSFDRCRYTYIEDLCEDIKRVTDERYWELNNKLSILNS